MTKHACYWFDSSGGYAAVSNSVGLPKKVDTVIVGGGIAGLSVLYHFLSHNMSASVILLDSDFPGYHTTGRCNGQISYASNISNINDMDDEVAYKYFDLLRDTNKYFETFVHAEELKCDYESYGGIYVGTSSKSIEKFNNFADRIKNLGIPLSIELLNQQEARSLVPSPHILGGLYIPSESSVHPNRLILSFMQMLEMTSGRRILPNAHVESVKRDGEAFKIKVRNRGVIQANNVVYCTGATIRDFVDVPVVTKHNHMVCTKMISSRTLRQFAPGNIIFDDASHSMRVFDDRMFFGRSSLKGVSRVQSGTYSRSSYNKLHAFTYTHFPGLKSGLEYVWSYHISGSSTGFPLIGPIPNRPNEYISAGYDDYGLALAFGAGALVRDFVMREDSDLPIIDLFLPK